MSEKQKLPEVKAWTKEKEDEGPEAQQSARQKRQGKRKKERGRIEKTSG